MKFKLKSIAILFFIFSFINFGFSYADNSLNKSYKIDDQLVDQLFSSAEDVSIEQAFTNFVSPLDGKIDNNDNTQLTAGIVALASYFLGVGWLIPIHRLILGTGNQAGKIIVLYCVTFSGCGFLLLIDGIMLLIDEGKSTYIDNSKFIMWM